MNDNIYSRAFGKFPNAKKMAVENFTMSYGAFDSNVQNNLAYDAKIYKWNKDTVDAIKFIFKNRKS